MKQREGRTNNDIRRKEIILNIRKRECFLPISGDESRHPSKVMCRQMAHLDSRNALRNFQKFEGVSIV